LVETILEIRSCDKSKGARRRIFVLLLVVLEVGLEIAVVASLSSLS